LTIDSSSQAILSPKARDTLRADCRTRLPETVNSYQPTIAPVLTIDGKYLFIDRKIHPDNSGGIYDQDEIWLSEKVGENGWSEPERLNTSFNTSGSDVLFSISPDGSRVLIYNSDISTDDSVHSAFTIARLSGTKLIDGTIQKIDDFYNESKHWYAHLSFDGKVLFLSLQRKNGYGGLDIYCSFYDSLRQTWTKPQNLGPKINTSGLEGCPFLANDGKTLYFASTGWNGNGKYDLYFSRRLDDTWKNWTTPVNLGKVINTQFDDRFFWLTGLGDTAYIVSQDPGDREGIYRVCLPDFARPLPYYLVALQIKVEDAIKYPNKETIDVSPLKDDINVYVKGEKDTTSIKYRYDAISGYCYFPLPGGENYNITIADTKYQNQSFDVNAANLDKISLLKRVSVLTPKGTVIKPVENEPLPTPENLVIRFSLDDYHLSKEESDKLEEFIGKIKKLNYSMILVQGYTDSTGSGQHNLLLSKKRAEEVRNLMIKAGIPAKRIDTTWYGAAKPVSTKPEENRRVEIYLRGFLTIE
jgi:outer membrane protein OmpA-like peptidoglycan-associated protein